MKSYDLQVAGLAEAVAAAAPSPKHADLLHAIRRLPGLADAFLATSREGGWLQRRQVLTPAGAVVHEDHATWLREELARDNGRADITAARLAALDLRLSQCGLARLYVIADRGGRQDDFIQLDIDLHDERMDRRLFSTHDWRSPPAASADVRELIERAEEGDPLADDQRTPCRPMNYVLRRAVDAGAFIAEASAWAQQDRARRRGRLLQVTDVATGETRQMTAGELDPQGEQYTWPGRRFVDEWTLSSAGRSGARLCRHWALQLSDHTAPSGERSMSLIPLWTFARPLAEVTRDGARSLHALFGKLVLAEHDYRILRRWMDAPYGF